MTRSVRLIHGDDLLYRFFIQLSESEPELFAVVPQMFIESMAIWLPLEVYQHSPVLLPWVLRDTKCRGNAKKGLPDEWASPNKDGYLRDDNSLVKSLPRSLNIRGPKGSRLDGRRMGTEFVASHIWRKIDSGEYANRVPILNTFVPNLVWLPSQIAKLSDHDGGIVQHTLKAMSRHIYRGVGVAEHLQEVVDEAWSKLPPPEPQLELEVNLDALNWFVSTDQFLALRRKRLTTVVDALDRLAKNQPLSEKVIANRYTAGLPYVGKSERDKLKRFLLRFLQN